MRLRFTLLCLCLFAFVSPVSAQTQTNTITSLQNNISQAWMPAQRPDGAFTEYVSTVYIDKEGNKRADARGRYSEAALGYALLDYGLSQKDGAAVEAGTRALLFATVTNKHLQDENPSVFETFAVVSALERLHQESNLPSRLIELDNTLQQWVCGVEPIHTDKPRYGNKYLVEAVSDLTLAKLDLPCKNVFASNKPALRDAASGVSDKLLAAAARTRVGKGNNVTVMLADPPHIPLSYHALTAAFLARSIALNENASKQERIVLRQMMNASMAFANPSHDIAYAGRSQSQAWTLSFTAYAAQTAASFTDTPPALADNYRKLASAMLSRLQTMHVVNADGFPITPAVASNIEASRVALDIYACGACYSGLTMIGLNWMEDTTFSQSNEPLTVPRPRLLNGGSHSFAVGGNEGTWFAVRGNRESGDLRTDLGLMAASKYSTSQRRWVDLFDDRPHSTKSGGSAGPILKVDGRSYNPRFTRLYVSGKSVIAEGGWAVDGKSMYRRGRFVFRPSQCGVKILVYGARKNTLKYSTFYADKVGRMQGGAKTNSVSIKVVGGAKTTTAIAQSGANAENGYINQALITTQARNNPVVFEHCLR